MKRVRQLVEQKRGGRPESWASYLARIAAVFRCPLSILERQLTVKAHAVTITPTAAQTAAARLNITAHQVHAMHLQSLDAIAFDLGACLASGGVTKRPWMWLRRPRSCPHCTEEGRSEPLIWRLPWITTCEWHETYLADWNSNAVPGAARTRSSVRTEHFTRLLTGEQVMLMGHEIAGNEALDLWRAGIALAQAARQLEGSDWRSSNCREADDILDIVQPLVLARDEPDAGELVHLWCQAVGISGPYPRRTFERVRHPVTHQLLAGGGG